MLAFVDEVASRFGMLPLSECSSNCEDPPSDSIASFDQRNLCAHFLEFHRRSQSGQTCSHNDDLRTSTNLLLHTFSWNVGLRAPSLARHMEGSHAWDP